MSDARHDMERAAQALEQVQARLEPLPGLSLKELNEALQRIRRNDFLIAVFGAFSAGKSSLLNALFGEQLLVVSPNPTTASVTHVESQSGEIESDKQVVVTAKTKEELWRDVESAFAALHLSPDSLETGIEQAGKLQAKDYPTSFRAHIRFLKAIHDGYDEMGSRLGTTWTTSLEALKAFSAVEKNAAYVARVDVHANEPWLRRGFIFVDTPGVDSIHRRHTDVAFRYMRHADAVIFVMYYTHAFTQGDRDFLLQLAGVQDVAQTNKLFSVINAVDLAKSEEEKTAVKGRVEQELKRLGIRQPRVYEVSSQLGLAARGLERNPEDEMFQAMARTRLNLGAEDALPTAADIREQSGVAQLEDDLTRYVENEGTNIGIDLSKRTLIQVARQLEHRIREEEARRDNDNARQAERQSALTSMKKKLEASIQEAESDHFSIIETFRQTLSELHFHAGERIRLRYRDLFRTAFHPGRFRVGKPQDKLQEASRELFDTLSRQVDIETRTLSLRAAQLAEKTCSSVATRWIDLLEEEGISFAFADEEGQYSEIIVDSIQSEISPDVIRPFYRYFSSPRQFFEGNGQREMLDASEDEVISVTKEEFSKATSNLLKHAESIVKERILDLYQAVLAEIEHAVAQASQPFDANRLNEWQTALTDIQAIEL